METCPKCDARVADSAQIECAECGVILSKAVSPDLAERQRRYRRLKGTGVVRESTGGSAEMGAKKALLIGTAVAIAIYVVPLTRFVLTYLAILVHELGHAVVGILFGYPSIPTLDLFYGGGVTFNFGRSTALLVLVGLLWIGVIYWSRHWPKLRLIVVVAFVLWLGLASTSLHDVLLNASGHGAELLFAGWCFYRVLSGNVRTSTERWLYAMCSAFLLISAWMFALRLVESEVARREYGAAKGGGHWMDMSRISRYFDTELVPVALAYFFIGLLVPVAAYLIYMNRRTLRSLIEA